MPRPPAFFLLVVCWFATVPLSGQTTSQPSVEGPVLIVPNLDFPLEIAVPAPAGFPFSGACQLREFDGGGECVTGQILPALATAGSGTPTPQGPKASPSLMVLTRIPARKNGTSGGSRRFQTAGLMMPGEQETFSFQDLNDSSLELCELDKPVLVYNHGVITKESVPESDPRRNRACYVHPVWGLDGETLTDDFPPDHYHHHGIFWTWPHVQIDDQEYDLWADRGGIKQQFVRWLCRRTGPVAAVLGVENGWYVGDRQVMIERVWLRAYKASDESRALDLELTWIPVDRPITLWGAPGKSYGGLTVRFRPPSRDDASTVITVPDGPTTEDLRETRLPWADFTSKFTGNAAASGAAVFVHPKHPDYPPTWLTRHYGPLCVGWPGVVSKTFAPGEPIRLGYRIWIHKGAMTADSLQQAYDAYVASAKVKWAAPRP